MEFCKCLPLLRKIIDDENFCLILIHNCESKEGAAASSEVLSCLRKLSAGLDIVRTARLDQINSSHRTNVKRAWSGSMWGVRIQRGYLETTGRIGPHSSLKGRCLPSTYQVGSRSWMDIYEFTVIAGPGYNGELDLNKLISPGVLSLVHLTENIKHVQGLFHLVDMQRGF